MYAMYREARLQRFWRLVAFDILMTICCMGQAVSDSKAENRAYPESAVAGVDAATLLSQVTGDSKPGKPVKNEEEESRKESWRRVGETVIYRGNAPTKVTVVENAVLVPATLVYQGTEVDVQLLLDTGASRTAVSTEVADRLNVNLTAARKARVQVVGGAVIEAQRVTLSRITVGPHTKKNAEILVIPHRGPPTKHDGLLGMDVLRGLKYNLDLERQIIIWE
jgi:clan AA aspartic protease (TIGR02281 family)